ncbi:Trm112 family protein [Thalassolituus sp. LLYu03]|uniref:Trm112 family protein n=1 Tax=Thalassolituus sp. LLYu03 TaxID=3421656 RepID=UPI003D2DF159
MDKQLLSMLVCPLCKGKLKLDKDAQELLCTFDGLAFPLRDGVPVMLEGEARRMSEEEKLEKAQKAAAAE